MLGVGAVDLDRAHPFPIVLDGPGGDVDMVCAPVSKLAPEYSYHQRKLK